MLSYGDPQAGLPPSLSDRLLAASNRPDLPSDLVNLVVTAAIEVDQLRSKVLYYRDNKHKGGSVG